MRSAVRFCDGVSLHHQSFGRMAQTLAPLRACILAGVLLLLITSCGGGGSEDASNSTGNQPPPPISQPPSAGTQPPAPVPDYRGETGHAEFSPFNSPYLLFLAFDARGWIDFMFTATLHAPAVGEFREVFAAPVSGDAVVRGVLADDRTGWFSTTYRNYDDGQVIFSGMITIISRSPNPGLGKDGLDVDFEFTAFTVDSSVGSFRITGTVNLQTNMEDVLVDRIQATFVVDDLESTWQEKIENVELVRRWSPADRSLDIGSFEFASGRVYEFDFGFFDYTTPEPLHFDRLDRDPISGGQLAAKGILSSAKLLPLNILGGAILYDQNDDGVSEESIRMTWDQFFGDFSTVAAVQEPPVAHIMPHKNTYEKIFDDALIKVGETASLAGYFSDDPNLVYLDHFWELVRIPQGSNATILDNTNPIVELTADVPGFYMIKLTVFDGVAFSTDHWFIEAKPVDFPNFNVYKGDLSVVTNRHVALGDTINLNARSVFEFPSIGQGIEAQWSWTSIGGFPLQQLGGLDVQIVASEIGAFELKIHSSFHLNDKLNVMVDSPVRFLPPYQFRQTIQNSVRFIGDFNGDQMPDLAVVQPDSTVNDTSVMFFYGAEHNFLDTGPSIGLGFNSFRVAAMADMDTDGIQDIVVQFTDRVEIVYGFSAQQSARRTTLTPSITRSNSTTRIRHIYTDDIDGDGLPDIAVVHDGTEFMSVVRQVAPGQFGSWETLTIDGSDLFSPSNLLQSGDVTGDGISDILIFYHKNDVPFLTTYPGVSGSSPGPPSAQALLFAEFSSFNMLPMDVNLDGVSDLIFWDTQNFVLEMINNGSGVFSLGKTWQRGSHGKPIVLDITGDGVPELLLSGCCASIRIFQASPSGLMDPYEYPVGFFIDFVGAADVNLDGKPDLLMSRDSSSFGLSLSTE